MRFRHRLYLYEEPLVVGQMAARFTQVLDLKRQQFERHPTWGATEIRIENKAHILCDIFGALDSITFSSSSPFRRLLVPNTRGLRPYFESSAFKLNVSVTPDPKLALVVRKHLVDGWIYFGAELGPDRRQSTNHFPFGSLQRWIDMGELAPLKTDHVSAHKHSIRHRAELEASAVCGCFYCGGVFAPTEIREWIDDGQTALCPYCPVDSVIGSASGYPITPEFLKLMHDYWF